MVNAPLKIEVQDGKLAVVNDEQYVNAKLPINVQDGKLTVVNDEQNPNASNSID